MFLLFCLMVLFQDTHKLVEVRFCLMNIWLAVKRISTSGRFRNSSGFVFLRSVHTFSWFLKSNWSSEFGHAETGRRAKKKASGFVAWNFFRSYFKVEWENGVWTKICFLSSGFLFACGSFTLIFCFFKIFLIWFFIEMIFPIHSLSVLGVVCCLVNENTLHCTSGLVLLCFLFRRLTFVFVLHLLTQQSSKIQFSELLLPLNNGFCARDVISQSV